MKRFKTIAEMITISVKPTSFTIDEADDVITSLQSKLDEAKQKIAEAEKVCKSNHIQIKEPVEMLKTNRRFNIEESYTAMVGDRFIITKLNKKTVSIYDYAGMGNTFRLKYEDLDKVIFLEDLKLL